MPVTCIAVDDEPLALQVIKEFAGRITDLQLVKAFDDAVEAMDYLKKHPVDILLIDVKMPDISGIEFVQSLTYKPEVIFTTAYKQFAYDGFELEAADFLLKPMSFDRFQKAIQKAVAQIKLTHFQEIEGKHYLFIRSEYKYVKIDFSDIEYIEALEDYLKIHLTNKRYILTLMTMKSIMEKLPQEKFKRIHRSYIAPLHKIKAALNKKIVLANNTELPVSDSYIEGLRKWYQQ